MLFLSHKNLVQNFNAFFLHKTKIEGKKNLQSSTPAIIVANHSSALDIFIIENLLGSHPHIWMTKHEYTKIPLFSILLKRMHIPVKRNDNIAAARAFLRAYHRAKNLNSHIVLFPEGTRHPDGKIHDFHPGFALLAKKLNRPVIPIAMTNLHKILPKNSLLINYHAKTPTISIGKPMYIETSESPSMNESFQEFATRVQTWIKNKTNNSNQAPSGLNPPVD